VVIDLTDIVRQRLMDIVTQNPSMTADDIYFEGQTGLWCLVTVSNGNGKAIEYDFIESEDSWKRTDVAMDYFQAAMEPVNVRVIVPDRALADVVELIRDQGAEGVLVSSHSAMGLIPLPLTY
jgi:hypothetical protein